ncbi:hypothetical protein FA95DRAFT_1564336, partial [Auriscalpium vulgare]
DVSNIDCEANASARTLGVLIAPRSSSKHPEAQPEQRRLAEHTSAIRHPAFRARAIPQSDAQPQFPAQLDLVGTCMGYARSRCALDRQVDVARRLPAGCPRWPDIAFNEGTMHRARVSDMATTRLLVARTVKRGSALTSRTMTMDRPVRKPVLVAMCVITRQHKDVGKGGRCVYEC